VVIGNGGSVDLMPPEFWEQDGCLYVGTNRAPCIIALRGVRLDAVVIRDCWSSMFGDMKVSRKFNWDVWQPYDAYKVGPAEQRHTLCDEFVRQLPGWQFAENRDKANNEAAVMANCSVVIMACNVAWHWGARDFQVTGLDYHGDMAAMFPPFDASTGYDARYAKPVPQVVERQFGEMRQAIETGYGSIVNCSPGTKLEALEKGRWRKGF